MNGAIIMAGGPSRRMRNSLGSSHKALVPVLGQPMLERNLFALLAAGITNIAVAINAREKTLIQFAEDRCRSLVEALGGKFTCFIEEKGLGTIGAARHFAHLTDALLVVNVDNLSTIDLNGFLARHRQSGAAMTIATHWQDIPMPFGEVTLRDGWVHSLVEKPLKPYHISSGTYVLSPEACALIPAKTNLGAPGLYQILVDRNLKVAAYPHQAFWIDVNDADGKTKAEQLILQQYQAFECFQPVPASQVVALLPYNANGGWLIRQKPGGPRYPNCLDLLTFPVQACEDPVDMAQSHCRPGLGQPAFLFSFDDLVDGQRIRHHLFRLKGSSEIPFKGEGAWLPMNGTETSSLSPPARRAWAALKVCGAMYQGKADHGIS